MNSDSPIQLWPEDQDVIGSRPGTLGETPNVQLATYLLAAGCTHNYVKAQAGFSTLREVATFARDDSTRAAVEELSADRVRRVGKRALVKLEKLLAEDHTDLRATVLAIRTGLEVSGDLKKDHAAPLKTVRELSVAELNRLIDSTQKELDARISEGGQAAGR